MSRYTVLLILNAPLILFALIGALTKYKMRRMSRRRFIGQVGMWIVVLIGLVTARPLYTWLVENNLTNAGSLSLFDVVQITAIVILLYIVNSIHSQVEKLESRLNKLHQELSIRLSE